MKKLLGIMLGIGLTACASYKSIAPVQDVNLHQSGHTLMHRVQRGETLYAVAWRYEKDYRELAQLNGLQLPYTIHTGDRLIISTHNIMHQPSMRQRGRQPVHAVVEQRYSPHYVKPIRHWIWPAKGEVVKPFLGLNKGIDISGYHDEPVVAAANGTVVYAENSIRGYGNLLIIKHNNDYFSAYAYNKVLLVKMGQRVRAGQVIAKMGKANNGRTLLHFEIRKVGKAVNPLEYLKSRNLNRGEYI